MHEARESSTTGHSSSPGSVLSFFAAGTASARLPRGNHPAAESATSPIETRYSFAAASLQHVDSTVPSDDESRLQHLIRNRFYDPRSGRFSGEDPLLRSYLRNRFAYVENRPTYHTDPMGLQAVDPLACVVAYVLAGAGAGAAAGAAGGFVIAGVGEIVTAPAGAAVGGIIGGLMGVVVCTPKCPIPPFPQVPNNPYDPKRTTCQGLLQSCLSGYMTGPCYACARICAAEKRWPYDLCPGSGKK